MDAEIEATVAGCTQAHRRLGETLESVDDDTVRRPSGLPGWTVAHVLAHLARNAESHVRMLEGALAGEAVEQYPGGPEQRSGDIEAGASLNAAELRSGVLSSNAQVEAAWGRMTPEAWDRHGLAQGDEWPCRLMPFHRWREVEIHHVDLGLGYSPDDWPAEYVTRELPQALDTVPDRLSGADRAAVLAWLVGRSGQPPTIDLTPWPGRR